VLGLTASPGAADTQEETAKDIQQLLNMFQADLQVVEEEVLAEQQVRHSMQPAVHRQGAIQCIAVVHLTAGAVARISTACAQTHT
jgi:hypothetical protein